MHCGDLLLLSHWLHGFLHINYVIKTLSYIILMDYYRYSRIWDIHLVPVLLDDSSIRFYLDRIGYLSYLIAIHLLCMRLELLLVLTAVVIRGNVGFGLTWYVRVNRHQLAIWQVGVYDLALHIWGAGRKNVFVDSLITWCHVFLIFNEWFISMKAALWSRLGQVLHLQMSDCVGTHLFIIYDYWKNII